MLLTTRVSYGIRALISLARSHEFTEFVSIKHISDKEGISGVYLEQIFNRLKKKGVIKSKRGPKGGYYLAKDPKDLSVLEIVLALEGSVAPGKCVSRKTGGKTCSRADTCPSKEIWDEIEGQIHHTLGKYSLIDLVERARILDPEGSIRSEVHLRQMARSVKSKAGK